MNLPILGREVGLSVLCSELKVKREIGKLLVLFLRGSSPYREGKSLAATSIRAEHFDQKITLDLRTILEATCKA